MSQNPANLLQKSFLWQDEILRGNCYEYLQTYFLSHGSKLWCQMHTYIVGQDIIYCWQAASCLFDLMLALQRQGLTIPVTSRSSASSLRFCLLHRSAFNLYRGFMGIHWRGGVEGHRLTFVYFKGYALPKCCCFAPRRPREGDGQRCVTRLQSIH